MPIYEYYCPRCEQKFEALQSLRAAENGEQPPCPKCGEQRVARVFSRFAAGTSSSSGSGPFCPPMAFGLAAILKSAGEPTRLRILNLLRQGDICVCDLQAVLAIPQPTISRH